MADLKEQKSEDQPSPPLDMEQLTKLKKQGNTEYINKNYKLALGFYSQALDCANIDIIAEQPSLINGTDAEHYKEMLNKIELNQSLQDKRKDISKIFSNRAACFLNTKQYILCIHNSNISLLYDSNNENGLYRRGLAYEKAEKYIIALKSYQKLLKINNSNQKALDGLNRMQTIIKAQTDRTTLYTQAINKLKEFADTQNSAKDSDIITNIATVMTQLYHSTEYHTHIIQELGFTHILYKIVWNKEKYSFELRTDCIHALNGIIQHCTDNEKYSQTNQCLISKGFESEAKETNYTQLLLDISKTFLNRLISVFESKTEVISKEESVFMQLLLQYLINLATNQYLFDKYSDDIFKNLVEYFKKLKYGYIKHKSQQKFNSLFKVNQTKAVQPQTSEEKKDKSDIPLIEMDLNKDTDTDSSAVISDVLVIILKYLSNAALKNNTANYKLLEKIRYTFFYQFLFSDFSKDLRIKHEILRYFVCCSGLKSAFDQVNDTRLAKLKTEYERRITQALVTPITNALKTEQFTSDNMRLVRALRALAIVLQSNHKLGADIAGKEDVLNCIVEVATVNEAKDEYKSEQSNIDEIGYLGCEVLALSCSNAQIREAIIKSNNQHLFAWILDTNDLMVRAYSANALSKFAAIDEDSRELALGGSPPNRCMLSCAAIIHYLLKTTPDTTDNDDNTDFDETEYTNYKVPLMNLCIETVSYLSLHIETKQGIIKNKNEILKLLVRVSDSNYFQQNRALRHGLLTIILNCCLSKGDVTRFMSDKEEQLRKLKKAVSKSLPNNPTKADDIIQSRAGDIEKVKVIQKELIKENCIYLIYRIVKLTNTENRRIDDYIHDEIGLSETDGIRIKKAEESRREERINWDPNKYKNETAQQKLQRKKLLHLQSQKTKYRSFELEEKLQMKICQVLMMISNIHQFRGNLVQQKAIRLSMDLFFANKHGMGPNNLEIRQMASVTVARICISINPILLNSSDLKPIIECLLKLVSNGQHELYIYEALLALCNISSISPENNGDDIKKDIAIHKNGWSVLRNAFEDEHDLINAGVLEIWCNLCTNYEVLWEKLHRNREIDIQIVTLFLQHDLRRVQRAAVNILAMATSCDEEISKGICEVIAANGGVVYLQCLLNIRQQTLIERFHKEKDERVIKMKQEMDRVILERVRIVMGNMDKYGFTMHNLKEHGMKKDVQKDFKKYMK